MQDNTPIKTLTAFAKNDRNLSRLGEYTLYTFALYKNCDQR